MYHSQQYLDIGGKFIENPFNDTECMFSVNLHKLVCQLHASGARHISDYQTIIMDFINAEINTDDPDKAYAIYKRVMVKLSEKGIFPSVSAH